VPESVARAIVCLKHRLLDRFAAVVEHVVDQPSIPVAE
jgi:hypothetical protein